MREIFHFPTNFLPFFHRATKIDHILFPAQLWRRRRGFISVKKFCFTLKADNTGWGGGGLKATRLIFGQGLLLGPAKWVGFLEGGGGEGGQGESEGGEGGRSLSGWPLDKWWNFYKQGN